MWGIANVPKWPVVPFAAFVEVVANCLDSVLHHILVVMMMMMMLVVVLLELVVVLLLQLVVLVVMIIVLILVLISTMTTKTTMTRAVPVPPCKYNVPTRQVRNERPPRLV